MTWAVVHPKTVINKNHCFVTGFCELIKNSKPTSVTPCSLIGINSSVLIKTFAGLASVGKTLLVEVWCFSGLGSLTISSPRPCSRRVVHVHSMYVRPVLLVRDCLGICIVTALTPPSNKLVSNLASVDLVVSLCRSIQTERRNCCTRPTPRGYSKK